MTTSQCVSNELWQTELDLLYMHSSAVAKLVGEGILIKWDMEICKKGGVRFLV